MIRFFSSDTLQVCPTISELRFDGCCHPCLNLHRVFSFLIDIGSSLGLWFGLSVFGVTDLGRKKTGGDIQQSDYRVLKVL